MSDICDGSYLGGCFGIAFFRFGENESGDETGQFLLLFDKAFEKADLFFTFNPEKKAKKALENAEERFTEAEESAGENKLEAVAEAMENYQENISLAETEAKAIKDEAKQKTCFQQSPAVLPNIKKF